jgi:hypothetical protein
MKQMKKKSKNKKKPGRKIDAEIKDNVTGYPLYPASEDIYSKYKEEKNINPDDVSKIKESTENENIETDHQKDSNNDLFGNDLDIPGSELDDEQENIGNEDEENNYYSLGGDDHDDLEEDKGE